MSGCVIFANMKTALIIEKSSILFVDNKNSNIIYPPSDFKMVRLKEEENPIYFTRIGATKVGFKKLNKIR